MLYIVQCTLYITLNILLILQLIYIYIHIYIYIYIYIYNNILMQEQTYALATSFKESKNKSDIFLI